MWEHVYVPDAIERVNYSTPTFGVHLLVEIELHNTIFNSEIILKKETGPGILLVNLTQSCLKDLENQK